MHKLEGNEHVPCPIQTREEDMARTIANNDAIVIARKVVFTINIVIATTMVFTKNICFTSVIVGW